MTLWDHSFLFLLIAFAGFIDSVIGGGGLISIPSFITFGVPAHLILGTNKWIASSGSLFTLYRYVRYTRILWSVMLPGAVFSALGALCGSHLSQILSPHWMTMLLVLLIPALLAVQYIKPYSSLAFLESISKRDMTLKLFPSALIIGAYDGFFGPGTGLFLFFALTRFLNMNLLQAATHGKILNVSSSFSALFYFLEKGQIYWHVALLGMVASALGNILGSKLVLKEADKIIKPAFYFVLTLLMGKCVYTLFMS